MGGVRLSLFYTFFLFLLFTHYTSLLSVADEDTQKSPSSCSQRLVEIFKEKKIKSKKLQTLVSNEIRSRCLDPEHCGSEELHEAVSAALLKAAEQKKEIKTRFVKNTIALLCADAAVVGTTCAITSTNIPELYTGLILGFFGVVSAPLVAAVNAPIMKPLTGFIERWGFGSKKNKQALKPSRASQQHQQVFYDTMEWLTLQQQAGRSLANNADIALITGRIIEARNLLRAHRYATDLTQKADLFDDLIITLANALKKYRENFPEFSAMNHNLIEDIQDYLGKYLTAKEAPGLKEAVLRRVLLSDPESFDPDVQKYYETLSEQWFSPLRKDPQPSQN